MDRVVIFQDIFYEHSSLEFSFSLNLVLAASMLSMSLHIRSVWIDCVCVSGDSLVFISLSADNSTWLKVAFLSNCDDDDYVFCSSFSLFSTVVLAFFAWAVSVLVTV